MKFHYITWDDKHPSYTYQSATGTSITIRPGDKSPDGRTVTKDEVHILVNEHNREVYNNLKNCKANLTDQQKADMKEWEEAHPGEHNPYKWNASIEHIIEEHADNDCSKLHFDMYEATHRDTFDKEQFWELVGQMTEKQRKAFFLVRIKKMTMEDTAEIMGIKKAAVSRLVSRAEEFMKNNFTDVNF